MRIQIIGFALAIALISVVGLVYFGGSDTAEAAIHPIVQSGCASSTVGDTPADPKNPPGQADNPSTGDGMPNEDIGDARGTHPWQNSNLNSRSGEGEVNCANLEDE